MPVEQAAAIRAKPENGVEFQLVMKEKDNKGRQEQGAMLLEALVAMPRSFITLLVLGGPLLASGSDLLERVRAVVARINPRPPKVVRSGSFCCVTDTRGASGRSSASTRKVKSRRSR